MEGTQKMKMDRWNLDVDVLKKNLSDLERNIHSQDEVGLDYDTVLRQTEDLKVRMRHGRPPSTSFLPSLTHRKGPPSKVFSLS